MRNKLSQIKKISIILDEAHHSYSNSDNEKRFRTTLEVLNQNNNIVSVLGMSGTPYVQRKLIFKNRKLAID
ncbi:hypothetical protein D3C80_2080830 [compost metagenome]